MSKYLLLLILSVFSRFAAAQHDVAKVRQTQGKYVFCNTTPTAAYDVAFTFQSTYKNNEKMTISDVVNGCMMGALLEAGAQLKPFDAIILQNGGTRDVAIKFKDNVPMERRALATASKTDGRLLFEFCEPVTDYKIIKTEKIAWYNKMFGGAYYTLAQVVANLSKTAQKTPTAEAIIFNENASYISFK